MQKFQSEQIKAVSDEENQNKTEDFFPFAVFTFEIPKTVPAIGIDASGNEPEKIGKFQIPVKDFVQNPNGGEGDARIEYTDKIVFQKVNHEPENNKSAAFPVPPSKK